MLSRPGSLVILLFASTLFAGSPEFEPNRGQGNADSAYFGRAGRLRAYVHDRSLDLVPNSGAAIRLSWTGASEGAWSAAQPTGNTVRYCNQREVRLCRDGVATYGRLLRTTLYPGVDWALYGRGDDLEYDLILRPGVDPSGIRLRVEGAPSRLDDAGTLQAGGILHWRPEAYQQIDGVRVPVEASLRPAGEGEFAFALGPHRSDLELVIDPVIRSSAVAGGSDDDAILGGTGGYRYGTTRSADWTRDRGAGGRDLFVQYTSQGATSTVFWGGEGDENIGGSDVELNNSYLCLVGWTDSRNAPVLTAPYDSRVARPYAGGASDGFFLEFARGSLYFASYAGGPGADRLYDVRRLGTIGYTPKILLAGETDDPAWPGVSGLERIGPGGKLDAIAGLLDGPSLKLVAIGGSGDDRAMRMRATSSGWAIAGETDSADFPATAGATAAAGRDLWIGRLQLDPVAAPALRLYGGTGDEQFGGLAVIAGQGLYLAGSTTSKDLPVATGRHHGGPTDGFLAGFDPLTAAAAFTTYIGGSGRDEIAAIEPGSGGLLFGGTTDSADLELPGLPAGQDASGGLDALFLTSEPTGVLTRGIRFGGSGDDRILGVSPTGGGSATLTGSSSSPEWLKTLDPYAAGLGAQDGFLLSMTFPAVVTGADPGVLWLGRDLQAPLSILAFSDPGMDGILTVRSSDPSRLLIAPSIQSPGTDQILLRDADRVGYYGDTKTAWLQALSDEGEVEVIIEGRAANSARNTYPRRSIRVRLAPTSVFAPFLGPVVIGTNLNQNVEFFPAPVLPDGSAGPPQIVRFGVDPGWTLTSSDPTGLDLVTNTIGYSEGYRLRGQLHAVRAGDYTVTPGSSRFPTAPGQAIAVSVQTTGTGPRFFYGQTLYLAKDHRITLNVVGAAGDTLTFTSNDPRVQVGTATTAYSDSVRLSGLSGSSQSVYIAAMAYEGNATVRVEGTLNGNPVAETVQFQLVPYKVTIDNVPVAVAVGMSVYPRILTTIQPPPQSNGSMAAQAVFRPELLSALDLRSSNPAVLEPVRRPDNLSYEFLAKAPGTVSLTVEGSTLPEFAGVSVSLNVQAARIDFGFSLIRIPAGTEIPLSPTGFAGQAALKAVRMRVPPDSPLRIQYFGESKTDMTLDFTRQYSAAFTAENAPAGYTTTLLVSAPGVEEFGIPVRVTEAVLVPISSEVRVTSNSPGQGGGLSYRLVAYEDGVAYLQSRGFYARKTVRARPVATPEGICALPSLAEMNGTGELGFSVTCSGIGPVTVSLTPVDGLAAAQPQFTARVVSQPAEPTVILPVDRILTGAGLQTALSLYTQQGLFVRSVTSNDPDRVRISTDPRARGSATVQIPANRTVGTIYVQGFDSVGVVTLTVTGTEGQTVDVPVHLFPATLATRTASNSSVSDDASAATSLDHPLSTTELNLDVRPFLVEPGTRKLIWTNGLSIRGGSDPVFVRPQSSDSAIVESAPPDPIVSEGDLSARLKFKVNATGDVVLGTTQPDGFVSVPDSSLRVHVFTRQLDLQNLTPLPADMQAAFVPYAVGSQNTDSVPITLTSLAPDKLLLSTSDTVTGQASVTAPLGRAVFFQALSGVQPGEKVRVRLEGGAAYAASEREIEFAAGELVYPSSGTLTLSPGNTGYLNLEYGPLDSTGRVMSNFSGKLRPGVTAPVRITSSDPRLLEVALGSIALSRSMSFQVRGVAPGRVQLRVEAPPQIVNRIPPIDAVVSPFEFNGWTLEPPVRYLVSRMTVVNPRAQNTPVTIASAGTTPLRFGTAASGQGAPAASSLTVTLAPNERRTLYVEPTGAGNLATVRLSAADFNTREASNPVDDPRPAFSQPGPLTVNLSSGTTTAVLVLSGANTSTEWPLGSAFGPLRVQLQSSNPQVVRVPAQPVDFAAGDSRKSIVLELVGRGDAVVTAIVPSSFAGAAPTRRDLVLTVR